MKARGATQTAVCIRLSLSPVYFSMWLRHKDIPKSTAALYTVHLTLTLALPLALSLSPSPSPNPNPNPNPNPDSKQPTTPSRFLRELPAEMLSSEMAYDEPRA